MSEGVKVFVRNNGPIRLEGENIVITEQEGQVYDLKGRTVVSLGRCGGSSNKPFCDRTHRDNGFDGTCAGSETTPPPAPADTGGTGA